MRSRRTSIVTCVIGTILKDELAPKEVEAGENKAIEATLKADGGTKQDIHKIATHILSCSSLSLGC